MLATTRSVRSFTLIPSPRCVTVLGTIEASVDTGQHVATDTSERSSASTIWQAFVQVQAESLRPLDTGFLGITDFMFGHSHNPRKSLYRGKVHYRFCSFLGASLSSILSFTFELRDVRDWLPSSLSGSAPAACVVVKCQSAFQWVVLKNTTFILLFSNS